MARKYEAMGESNGHHWIKFETNTIKGAFLVCCRDCGTVRRRDDKNKPCPGKVGISLRANSQPQP